MGLQESKQSEGNPYDGLPWLWIPFSIVVSTLLGVAIGYIILRVAGL